MAAEDTDDSLSVVIPEPVEITIAGETLQVRPITLAQLGPLAKACHGFAPLIEGALLEHNTAADLVDMVGRDAPSYQEAIAIAVGKPADWVGERSIAEAIALARVVLKVNADFFSLAVLPQIKGLIADVAALAGRIPSSDSSAPATAAPTS